MRMYLTLGCPAAIPNTRKIKIWVNVSLNQEFFPPLDCYVRARKAKSRHIRTQKIYIPQFLHYQFSSVQLLSHVWLFATPWTTAHQAFLSISNFWCLLKLMSIELVVPSNHLILGHPLFLPPSVFPNIRVFLNESVLRIRWPKYWSFSFSISPSNEYSGLTSFRMDWLDLLAVQGTLKSLLQHHSQKHQFFSTQLSFYSPTLTSTHDYWKNHSFD